MSEKIKQDGPIETCDLCVVGAGVAGLNALAVAREYLPSSARVILVDERRAIGGMWNDTYDYVRLHQPHRMFTAGDIKWRETNNPAYLANKSEVLTHLNHCAAECGRAYNLDTFFGFELNGQEEIQQDGEFIAELQFNNTEDPEGVPLIIRAKRCIKAFGFRVPTNPPLSFSSSRVESISTHGNSLFCEKFSASDAPCYIVGGGKTAMDTAATVLNHYPDREVNLIVGRGTIFLNRDKLFPRGLKRWWGGKTTLDAFVDLASHYDGTNADEVFALLKSNYTIQLDENFKHYFFGILSEKENFLIKNGVEAIVQDYLTDVEDQANRPVMMFRDGQPQAVPDASWFINCTGYIAREVHDYDPYVSPHGTIVSVQPTSGIHFLSTFGAYFLTHLLFLGKLSTLKLYELDYQDLIRKDRFAFPFVSITQTLYNAMLIMDSAPASVMIRCGVDFDNWFPFHRRLLGGAKLRRNQKRYRGKFKAALDTVQRKHGIRCGELVHDVPKPK